MLLSYISTVRASDIGSPRYSLLIFDAWILGSQFDKRA